MLQLERFQRFDELLRTDRSQALCLLYTWIRTGVLNKRTAVACFEHLLEIVPC